MDASRQAQYDANNTGASMYLSFDSSMSSVAYKTLETTTNEHSIISNMDCEDTTPENSQGLNQDSTLEALDSHVDYIESTNGKTTQPHLSAVPNRVLQQFNVVCSTPTKEQLLRSVEVVRGSSAERCVDLRRAFMDMEDKDKENALPPTEVPLAFVKRDPLPIVTKEESLELNENTSNPKSLGNSCAERKINEKNIEDGKAISNLTENKDPIITRKNVGETHFDLKYIENQRMLETITENEAPSMIDKELANLNPANTFDPNSNDNRNLACIITENKDSSNINEYDEGHKSSVNVIKLNTNENEGAIIVTVAENKVHTVMNKKDAETKKSADSEPSINNNSQKPALNNPAKKDPAIVKNKRNSIAKKPICEPDLLTNRPSRIATNTNKRLSVNDFGIKTNLEKEISTEIPKLMNKVLKFAESTTVVIDKTKTAVVFDKNKPISYATKGRPSMLPSTALSLAEKRPFAYTQRMSVLVKTTLNSPARKIARRSCAIAGPQNWKSLTANNIPPKSNRKSMLPVGKTAQTASDIINPPIQTKVQTLTKTTTATTNPSINTTKPTTTTIKPTTATAMATKSIPPSRKSVYPIDKTRNELQKPASVSSILPATNTKLRQSVAGAKLDTSFVCSVCGSKFSIKSLLDAHKRSHEGDGLPAFVKKTTSTTNSNVAAPMSQTNGVNKCKYCDKKFALVRALHIHLLQNCSKIPPKEKRKLTFHEMDHVEKAQLPAVFHGNSSQTKGNSHEQVLTTVNGLQQRCGSDLSSISVSSTDSMNDKRALAEITMIANNAAAAVDSLQPSDMAPPAVRSVKKGTAHTGVHRTPNKSIICHTCKISFKTIMDQFQHNMKLHFNNTDALRSAEINEKRTQ